MLRGPLLFGSLLGHTYPDDPKQSEMKSCYNSHEINKNAA